VYIHRTLLFLLAFAIIFLPSAQEWSTSGGSHWYRPFLIWGLLVFVAWWNSRRGKRDDI
jgi:hypothetical protein